MALVAFDLDNTLGFFEHINPWADFFSVDTLENRFNRIINPDFKLSASLQKTLRIAERVFVENLLNNRELLETVLRPNLSAFIIPLIKAKAKGTVRAVCIYSNTWNTFSVHVGKALIEAVYDAPGLFDAVVDASHPIREIDWKNKKQGSQIKSFENLTLIFKKLCKVRGTIRPSDILFIDERMTKHEIKREEVRGLVYLKPTEYFPRLSEALRYQAFQLGMSVIDECRLFKNMEYLDSDIFNCLKYGAFENGNTYIPITNIADLIEMTEHIIRGSGKNWKTFKDDSREVTKVICEFLIKVKN